MLRYLAGAGSSLLLIVAGLFAWQGLAQSEEDAVPQPPAADGAEPRRSDQAPPTPPSADERTREQRRFDRADRDDDGRITLAELYHPRRTGFARLDGNGDGRLTFEEWAVTTSEKFTGADADRDGNLTRAEYATTAPRRRASTRRNCAC